MTAYEYHIIAADWRKGDTIPDAELKILNPLGAMGWDLVNLERDQIGRFTLLTFKRQRLE